jgi:hypothetical protein
MATIRELLGDAYKEGMTFEEVETALATKNLADLSTGNYVAIGKYNSAISERDDFKAKYNAKLTEAEKEAEAAKEREAHYKRMERENSIYKFTEKLGATISDKTILGEVATLMADGKYEEAFDKQNTYFANERATLEEKVKQELMQSNPQSNPQNEGGGEITKEQFAQMGVAERTKLYKENPQLYSQLNNT